MENFVPRLYMGDFRWETTYERTKASINMLVDALNANGVNLLYLDNTCCKPSYAFPSCSHEVAAQQVVDIIASHPNHDMIIGIDTVGKEDLLLHISCMIKLKFFHRYLRGTELHSTYNRNHAIWSSMGLKPVEENESLLIFTPISGNDGIKCHVKCINHKNKLVGSLGAVKKLHEYIYAIP